MSREGKSYTKNIEDFSIAVEHAFVSAIYYETDLTPTFDTNKIPFDFVYSHSVSLITNKGNFRIGTAMTSEGIDTFWIIPLSEIDHSNNCVRIESSLNTVVVEESIHNLPFKMSIHFNSTSICLYCADIYEGSNDSLDYKINDEMILVFSDTEQASIFETLSNHA